MVSSRGSATGSGRETEDGLCPGVLWRDCPPREGLEQLGTSSHCRGQDDSLCALATRSHAASALPQGLPLPESTPLAPLNQTWAEPPAPGPKGPMKEKAASHPLIGATRGHLPSYPLPPAPSAPRAGVWTDVNIFLKTLNQNLANLSSVTRRGTAVCPCPQQKVEIFSALCPKALKIQVPLWPLLKDVVLSLHPSSAQPRRSAALPAWGAVSH